MRELGLPCCLLLALSGLLIPLPADGQPESGATYTPLFEESACPFEASPQVLEQVRCGWLTVPQNRAAPEGKQLRLAVAILKSTDPTPRPDPIVFLSGGPGGKSVEFMPARATSSFWNRLRAERDIVFFDQRGTGYSEPELCPAVADEQFRMLFLGLSPQQRSERMQTAFAHCAGAMREQGVDLSQIRGSGANGLITIKDVVSS
jgi:pimeloyl-ACP methyl ester carboxylesterase